MKHKTRKLFSILLALVMVAGLLPLGQVAYAYSEGDIPGTTGTGKASDPIMVDNFAELKAACGLATFETDLYIKFENKTVEETLPFDAPSLTSAIRLNTGYVHLILDGSYVFKANHIDKALYGHFFEVASGGFLEISGNGKLSFSPMLTGATNAVVLVSGGTVEINSGHLDGHPLNWAVWGRAISYRTGKLTINGGTFTGYNDQSNPDSVDAVAITPPSSASENFVQIYGGTFSSSSKNTPTGGSFGLSVWGTSTFNKYEVIKLAGGIFDGIEVNVGEAKIGDILEEGYHTYYAGSGNIAPAIEALKASTEKIKIDKNTYTVSFNNGGGTGSKTDEPVNAGAEYTLPAADTFTAPSADKEFDKWSVKIGSAEAVDKKPNDTIQVIADTTVTAVWKDKAVAPTTYNVTVTNDGNGTGSASPTFGPTGTVVNLTATPNSGYELLGWQVVSGGVTIMGDKFTIGTKDVEVKAIFGLIPTTTYEVTFDANGGSVTPTSGTTGTDGKLTSLPTPTHTNANMEFLGWFTAASGGTEVKANDTVFTGNDTIYAHWKDNTPSPTTYTITFNANGGSVTPTSGTTGTDGKLMSLPTPTRSGNYSFDGWYTAATGGTKVTVGKTYTADTIIYAHWTYNGGGSGGGGGITTQYTLTYNTNGGSAVSATKHNSGATVTLTATPTREGFTFDGWYSDAALTNKITSVTMDGNKTVYAGWKENENPNTGAHDCPSKHLKDVDINAWYHEYVDYVIENGLMYGIADDRFGPDVTTTRAMIVTILYRLENSPAVEGSSPFDDVAEGLWYTDAVKWAEANEIVEGYSPEKFGPNDLITREQLAAIMYRYSAFKGYDVSKAADLAGYTDASSISDWAVPAMKWAVAEGLIAGRTTTTLVPRGNATRAEAAAILMRYIEKTK